MASPIKPTPMLRGKDAERLLRDLERVRCSPDELHERAERARKQLTEMLRPKGKRK